MWEYIKAVYAQLTKALQAFMSAMIEYSQKLLRALYGMLILTAGHALKLMSDIFIGALILAIALPSILLTSFAIAYVDAQHHGFWSGLLTGFTYASGLFGVAAFFTAVTTTLYVYFNYESILLSPFKGLEMGWNQNMHAIHEAFLNIFRWSVPINWRWDNFSMQFRPFNGAFAGDMMDNLHNLRRNMEQGTMDMAQIDAMALSEPEITTLINEQVCLSDNDIQQLETIGATNEVLKNTLDTWKNTKNRLDNDACPVFISRPEREDTIVLVKQYEQNGQWLPIPNGATIFDKETFVAACQNSARHPVTRDSYFNPTKYALNDAEYTTRYRFHAYYQPGLEQGVSQELNQLGQTLKNYLNNPAATTQQMPATESVAPVVQSPETLIDDNQDEDADMQAALELSLLNNAPTEERTPQPALKVASCRDSLFHHEAPPVVVDTKPHAAPVNDAKKGRQAWLDKLSGKKEDVHNKKNNDSITNQM